MVISYKNIVVGYQSPLVKADQIELQKGMVYSLIGPNGSGKSTLLLSMAGIQPFMNAELTFEDQKLDYDELTKYIAFVDTTVLSSSQLRVEEVLKMGRYKQTNLWHQLKDEDLRVMNLWVEKLNIKNWLYRYMNTLSDGQKQLVMIARALIEDTPIIVLDEPTAFLDVTNTVEVMKILQNVAQEHKKTVLFTSHDIQAVIQISDYIMWIQNKALQIQKNNDSTQKIPLSSIFGLHDQIIDEKGHFKLR